MSGSCGAGAALPAAGFYTEGVTAEWLCIYDRVEAQVDALCADRARMEAVGSGLGEASLRGDKKNKFTELQELNLEDVTTGVNLLALQNTEFKEVEGCPEYGENTADHEHSVRELRTEVRKLKGAFETLISEKDKEVSALHAVQDFLWNRLRTMGKDNTALSENRKLEATQAIEELQNNLKELQVASQKKDCEIARLQGEAVASANKLQGMHYLAKEKDRKIEQLHGEYDSLLAGKDFVWNKLCKKEQELRGYVMLLKDKQVEAAQAIEAAEKLRHKLKELGVAAEKMKKDDENGRLQAEAGDGKTIQASIPHLELQHLSRSGGLLSIWVTDAISIG
ncbi:uncharacterized protein [Lolium perenne]|uniref:uncharacterized protein n=1 Tax=Lolium perenne TaxID=4522 RepID=UPI0021F5C3D9|nr:uncharacterized protein LOC127292374 [Lolium perenne]